MWLIKIILWISLSELSFSTLFKASLVLIIFENVGREESMSVFKDGICVLGSWTIGQYENTRLKLLMYNNRRKDLNRIAQLHCNYLAEQSV